MGSNNSKVKKKDKFRKLKKFQKFKKTNRTKRSAPELCEEANFVKTLPGIQDIFNYRLSDQQIYSRSYAHDHDIPKIRKFTQVRERFLSYLLTVVKNNCAFCGSPVAEDVLHSLSSKLEQHALVSSLQIDVYENFLNKIINDIEKCTKERQIHNEVKKLLPDSEEVIICGEFSSKSKNSENCLETITISDSSDGNLSENEVILENQSVFNSKALSLNDPQPDQCPSDSQPYEPYTVRQDSNDLSSLSNTRTNEDYNPTSTVNSNFGRKESEGTIRANNGYDPASHNPNLTRKEPEEIIRANDYDSASVVNPNFVRKESEEIIRANDYDPASNHYLNSGRKELHGNFRTNDEYDTASTVNTNSGRKESEGTIRANNRYDPASHNSTLTRKEPEGIIRANDYDPASNHYSNSGRKESEGTIRSNEGYDSASHNPNLTRKEPEEIIRVNDYDTPSNNNPNFIRKEPDGTFSTSDDYDPASNDYLSFTRNELEAIQLNELEICEASPTISEVYSPSQIEFEYFSDINEDLNPIPVFSEKSVNNETHDPYTDCSKVIEKCMEDIFSVDEISDEFLENARAHIIQLLEDENLRGKDEAECAENEKISENEMECETEMESDNERDFAKRLEKMRPFFNIDERPAKPKIPKKPKKSRKSKKSKPRLRKKAQRKLRRLTAWKNEKIIQQYKVTALTSKLSYEKREEMGQLFNELFGQDSDEENEFEHCSTHQFKMSCIERISSWVVKHLTPFYNKKRIVGRNVFKSLGRRISQKIIDKIQYPDERTVKYFVRKFFPPHRRYGLRLKRNA